VFTRSNLLASPKIPTKITVFKQRKGKTGVLLIFHYLVLILCKLLSNHLIYLLMQLSEKKARLNQFLALLFTSIIGICYFLIIYSIEDLSDSLYYIFLIGGAMACYSCYRVFTEKYRARAALAQTPFPVQWRTILEEQVAFYNKLTTEERERFETEIQIFLYEKQVTGIKTEVDDQTLVLVAASALIPVFGFPEWEYENLGEILIYPDRFSKDFRQEGQGRHVAGMVGSGLMNGVMILSKKALWAGFNIDNDKRNVGIHEFVHLLDASDGAYDGIPERFLEHQYVEPWIRVMHQEMQRIRAGQSTIDAYGGSSPTEFFAVTAEYFFEQPQALQNDHPELYALLRRVFQQDTKQRFKAALQATINYKGRQLRGNALCPCQSGAKYKNCCMKNRRSPQ
jgi:Mlc titration factor MtfA (ptsG expression regulator)